MPFNRVMYINRLDDKSYLLMTQLKALVTHGVKGFLFATAY